MSQQPIVLTPGEVRAWLILADLAPIDLYKRPARKIAEATGTSISMASRKIQSLIRKGIVTQDSAKGLIVERVEVVKTIEPYQGISDSRSRDSSEVNLQVNQSSSNKLVHPAPPTHCDCSEKTGEPIATEFLASQEAAPSSIGHQKIKTIIEVVCRDRRKDSRSRKVDANNRLLLQEAYASRRRRIEPEYEPLGRGLEMDISRAVTSLTMFKIQPVLYGRYLDWLFEYFRGVSKLAFPPTRVVASEAMMDRFKATLGRRRIDHARAISMLHGAGFSDVNVGVVVAITRRLASEGRHKVPDSLTPATHQAVTWLLPRLGDIGYIDDEEKSRE